MPKILIICEPNVCETYIAKALIENPKLEFIVIDKNDIPKNIEDFKKQFVLIENPILNNLPELPDLMKISNEIDKSILQYEGKLNRKAKKWQSPYKYHR